MPRGRKKSVSSLSLDERIKAKKAEVDQAQEELKARKAELRKLEREKRKEAESDAVKKAEEDALRIANAVAGSGKSVEDILEFLKK